jgi:hypothetical protein
LLTKFNNYLKLQPSREGLFPHEWGKKRAVFFMGLEWR